MVRTRTQLKAAMMSGLAAATAAGLLTGLALSAPAHAAAKRSGVTAGLPLSAAQMRADRRLHDASRNPLTTVTGIVRTAQGAPLAGVCVTAYGPSGRKSAVTSAEGRYFISGLRGGRYQFGYRSCAETAVAYLPEWYGSVLQRAESPAVVLDSSTLRRTQSLAPETLYPADSALGDPPSVLPQHGSDVIAGDQFGSHRRVLASAAALAQSVIASARQAAHLTPGTSTASASTGHLSASAARGTISGTVTSPSGQGLKGICVEAGSLTSFTLGQATTGAGGHYRVRNLPAGQYEMVFYTGCGNYGNWLFQIYKNIYNPMKQPTTVKVRSGHSTTINPVMKLGGEISGTVRGPAGRKLSHICVSPLLDHGSDDLYSGAVVRDGVYHARGLPAGTYQMGFAPCGANSVYAPTLWPDTQNYRAAAILAVRPPKLIKHIDETMPLGGIVKGTITSATTPATPLAGMCVFVEEDSGLYDAGLASSNPLGRYTVKGLPAGPYTVLAFPGCEVNSNYVQATYPTKLAVYSGATAAGINLALPVGDIISGTVTSATTGKPVRGICAAVSLSNGLTVDETASAKDGSYSVDQLAAGKYEVQFVGGCGNPGSYAPQGYKDTNVFDPQTLSFPSAGLTLSGIDAAMQPGPEIRGIVRDTSGHRLSGICVQAFTAAGVVFSSGTTSDGSYHLPNLAPGQYQVIFGPGCGNSENLLTEFFPSQISQGAMISAGSGTVTGINAALPPAGGLAGVVRTATGKQVGASCIILTGLSGDAKGQLGEVLLFGAQYGIIGVPTGTWQVAFVPACAGLNYATQYYKDKPSPAGFTRVSVRPFRTVYGVSSALVRGGSISGRLTSAGKPATQMCIIAQNISVSDDYGGAVTNSNGDYKVVGLNSGRYELEAYPCGPASRDLATVLLPEVVSVSAPKNTGHVNSSISLAGTITGRVLGGSPTANEANICVEALQTNGIGYGADTTTPYGKYTITGLTPGYYKVYFGDPACTYGDQDLAPQWYPDAATQASGQLLKSVGGATMKLSRVTLSDDGSISGAVTRHGGGALPGVCVAATQTSPVAGQPVYAVTRSTGSYSIIDLPPGRYRVRFSSGCGAIGYRTQWWNDEPSGKTAKAVTVTTGTTTSGVSAALVK